MKTSRIVAALIAALLFGCSGSSSVSGGSAPAGAIAGRVVGSAVQYPGGKANSSATAVDYAKSTTGDTVQWSARSVTFANALVCIDGNDDGICGPGEDSTTSGADGSFVLNSTQSGPLTAIVGSSASYVDPTSNQRVNVAKPMILRAAPDQLRAGGTVLVSALSSELLRLMQASQLSYTDAQQAIAAKLSLANTPALPTDVTVSAAQVLADPAALGNSAAGAALLFENQALQGRYALAKTMLDRGYVSDKTTDAVATIQAAEVGAFAPEDIPRYDHLFVVIFENHSNMTVDSPQYPNFYAYLNKLGNKAANYFSTGDPSEPNYISVGSGDTWGVTNDDGWNCVPDGDTADLPTDVYNPRGTCTDDAAHNIINRRNMFSALYQAGIGARVYSESMDPGQDPRVDSLGNSAIMGANKASGTMEPLISDLYKNKHHPAINFDDVRNRPDFFHNLTRSVGGGQWDDGITAYAQAHNISWNVHQLEDDLKSGDVGALNFIIPDQCDDIHGTGTAVKDCVSGSAGIKRGDAYGKYLVDTIQASPIWNNGARKVGIVFIFDEGSSYLGSSSCCGWNSGGGDTNTGPVGEDNTTAAPAYSAGNEGDGPTIFMVMNNQPNHPKAITDSDTYSHFSFVRTLQDMFALADPAVDTSYMNRSKYTQAYIAANQAMFPEYNNSLDTHFDAVRPMNHNYVMKPGDRVSGGVTPGISGDTGVSLVSLGPDPTQINIWAFQ